MFDHSYSAPSRGSSNRSAPALPTRLELLSLIHQAQSGEITAWEQLFTIFAPLLKRIISRYRGEPILYDELHGEAYLQFHRLVLQFDVTRGPNVIPYLLLTLGPAMGTRARQYREIAGRERPLSSLGAYGHCELSTSDPASLNTASWLEAPLPGSGNPRNLECSVVERLTAQAAMADLEPRDREIVLMGLAGYSSTEIAAYS